MTRSRGTLYLLPSRPVLDDEAAVRRIAAASGVSEYDVRQRCGKNRLSLLLRSDETDSLGSIRDRLRDLGHGAAVLSDDAVRALPFPLAARGVSITSETLAFLDAEGRVLETLSGRPNALLLVANLDHPGRNPVSPLGARRIPKSTERLYAEAERELAGLLTTHLEGIVIDVIADGGRRVRIRSRRFNFLTLGDRAGPSVAQNMHTLFTEILKRVGRPLVDTGFGGLRPPVVAGIGPQRHDDLPCDRPDGEEERDLESYSRCLTLLWRSGLFTPLLTPLPAAVRFHTTSIGAAGAPEAPEEAPRFWTPPPGATAGPPAVRSGDLARIGPVALVGPIAAGLALSGYAAFQGHVAAGLGAGTALCGLLAGVHAFTLLARRRNIENVPTSRIRSAAIGPVEVRGAARAITPLLTPFSSMPCVYYEYRIVSNERSDPAADSWLSLWGGRRSRERATIQAGCSGRVPFLVADDTGEMEVDPAGAIVEVRSEQSFTKVPFAGGMVPAGTQVLAWEKYIPEGYTVHVMGELQQRLVDPAIATGRLVERIRDLKRDEVRMAACDLDGNGVLDDREWSQATGALAAAVRRETLDDSGRSDTVVLGRPRSGGLFLISERSEKDIVRSFALRSRILFAAGGLLLVAGLALFLNAPR